MKACCGSGQVLTLVDVGQDTTLRDGDVSEELVQLLIVPDGELEVAGDDAGLLVVASGVASELENLGRQVLEHRGEVDGRTSTDALGVVALPEKTVDTTDGESETSLGRTAGWKKSEGCSDCANCALLFWSARELTTAHSSHRSPCHRTCRLQTF